MLRTSRQREAILAYLRSTKAHPSADAVYQNVRKSLPNVSLGTVYRNLARLAEDGTILRFPSTDGVDHFDADTSPHYHFTCRACGKITDLSMKPLSGIERTAERGHGLRVESHSIMFYGICAECETCEKQ